MRVLTSETESCHDGPIAPHVLRTDIAKEPSSLPHQFKKAQSGVFVLLMSSEMGAQLVNTFSEDRDLHFSGASVAFVGAVLLDDFFLTLCCKHSSASLFSISSHFRCIIACTKIVVQIVEWLNESAPSGIRTRGLHLERVVS